VVPDVDQLTDDAFIIIAAATDTTGNAMTIATYKVLSNPSIYGKLKDELKEAFPDGNVKLDFVTLEKLPYLVRDLKPCLSR
jgi:cytochrome P450